MSASKKTKKSAYPPVGDGWESVKNPLLLACCDCGLVHSIHIRRVASGYQMRFDRNDRSTGQLRRHNEHACVPKDTP